MQILGRDWKEGAMKRVLSPALISVSAGKGSGSGGDGGGDGGGGGGRCMW